MAKVGIFDILNGVLSHCTAVIKQQLRESTQNTTTTTTMRNNYNKKSADIQGATVRHFVTRKQFRYLIIKTLQHFPPLTNTHIPTYVYIYHRMYT